MGIGSGLDINSIVTKLVAAEGDPVSTRLNTKEAHAQGMLSAVGTLKSALSEFQSSLATLKSADSFTARSATSADSDYYTASATDSAAVGSYAIEVVKLAQASKLRTAGFTGSDAVVGTGTLTITSGSESIMLAIDSSHNTLADIRDAINSATGNTFVNASIINVDDGAGGTESRLLLSGTKVGLDNALTVTTDDSDLNDTDTSGLSQLATVNLVSMTSAQDAQIKIDNQTVTRSSNSISDAIDGVTLELVKAHATAGDTTSLNVAVDTSTVSSAVNDFVKSYNTMIGIFNQLNSYDATTGKTGTLFGDATLRSVESQIRREITSNVSGLTGDLRNVVDLGITSQDDGTLTVDATALSDAITNNLSSVATLFSGSDGVATRLDSLLEGYVKATGILDTRTTALNDQISDIGDQRAALNRRLASLQSRLTQQFTALDTLVSQLNSTSTFLSQQLANLPGAISVNKQS